MAYVFFAGTPPGCISFFESVTGGVARASLNRPATGCKASGLKQAMSTLKWRAGSENFNDLAAGESTWDRAGRCGIFRTHGVNEARFNEVKMRLTEGGFLAIS